MTRKCAICKETNYKNGSSFFSAPKDPEVRKLWQEAIGIENYVVKDETYVCSKHFYPTDVITHWFSGVPPNVITIKYKKFRLRPGAVPKININPNEIDPQFIECHNEFEVNRGFSPLMNPLSPSINTAEETFSIPREDIREEIVETLDFEDPDSQHSFGNVLEYSAEQESQEIQKNYNSKESTKSSSGECEIIISHNLQEPSENQINNEQKLLDSDDSFNNGEEQNWEVESNLIELQNKQVKKKFIKEEIDYIDERIETKNIEFDDSNLNNESMLFEDLLEAYTDVNLPKGWISFVISKGHGTTIVYSFTKINKSGIPVVEKQVFVKNNMILRCSIKDRNIDPLIHNLIKDNRNLKVQTLMDVEELINEFNNRQICEGNPVKNLMNVEASREGSNWRHTSCSLILNNGLNKCSKCASLSSRKRKIPFDHNTYSVAKSRLVKRQKKIKVVNESLKEQVETSKCKDRLSSLPLETVDLLSEAVDLLKLPKIQKVMIKECFKFRKYPEKNGVQFSRTWIFLCLLLYIESPEMYKYMLLNKYMNLPPLFTVRAYLRRVKADREFYNIFQQSVETFQPFNEELKAGNSK